MFDFLRGRLHTNAGAGVVLDVGGAGYKVACTSKTSEAIGPEGADVTLLIYVHQREDDTTLYGFAAPVERAMFRLMIDKVTGLGPGKARQALSHRGVAEMVGLIRAKDVPTLTKTRGLGRKLAERVVVELYDQLEPIEAMLAGVPGATTPPLAVVDADARQALVGLGFSMVEATKAVTRARQRLGAGAALDALIRGALADR